MKQLFWMLMVTVLAFGTAACSKDDSNDDPFGGGSASVTVNGTTFGVNQAYWSATTASGKTFYTIYMLNVNPTSVTPSYPVYWVSVTYGVEGGSTSTFATGSFTDFEVAVSAVYAAGGSSKDVEYYAFNKQDGNNTTLKVSSSGVSFGAMTYKDFSTSTKAYTGGAFSFSGSIGKLPLSLSDDFTED